MASPRLFCIPIHGLKLFKLGNMDKSQDIKRHESTCKIHDAKGQEAFIQEFKRGQQSALADMGQAGLDNDIKFYAGNEDVQSPVLSDASMASNAGLKNVPPQPVTEFYPHSGHKTLLQTFEEFGVAPEALKAPPADEEPWHSFQSCGDFKFSEIGQVNKLLSLIICIVQGDAHITLKNDTLQEGAPIWDWAIDLLDNPLLAPHFVWDAQHIYKHNGTNFKRFFNEPWTADQCQNGKGIGGGRVVGWLPIIEEEVSKHGKLGFINLNVQCNHPCPVCLIPLNELSDLSKSFAIRTTKDVQDTMQCRASQQWTQLFPIAHMPDKTQFFKRCIIEVFPSLLFNFVGRQKLGFSKSRRIFKYKSQKGKYS
ncbi:hypothetical protein EV424DRAFT_1347854 [Suillus variegatus]|nr:hypothetical protein EV424DRAFT_1347854 [Suillus variegatus]